MVHSSMMNGEHFDQVENFDTALATPSVTWSCGGKETYHLLDKRCLAIQPAGVLTIAANQRYAYDAASGSPFRSTMISFPRWMREEAAAEDDINELTYAMPTLLTRFCRPEAETFSLMTTIATHCVIGSEDYTLHTELITLLYAHLLDEQHQHNSGKMIAVKISTRQELTRRVERNIQFILEEYRKPDLSIEKIAGAACLSRFQAALCYPSVGCAEVLRSRKSFYIPGHDLARRYSVTGAGLLA